MVALFPQREIFLNVAGIDLYWYGLMYVVAFALAWLLVPRLAAYRHLVITTEKWHSIVLAGFAGVLIGGRIGYAVLYEPAYYWQYPLKIFALSEGGMAFHGGLLGAGVAVWIMSHRYRLSALAVLDIVVIPVAIGLSLGRIGNFINQELFGTVTALPWGISVPGVPGLRHPVQLYAALKDVGVAALCSWYFFRSRQYVTGRTSALFLIGYGTLRFLIGFFREIDGFSVVVGPLALGEGQVLTIPLILLGAWLWFFRRNGTVAV